MTLPVTLDDVVAARGRIALRVHRTPVLTSRRLDARAGCRLFFKCETFQRVGAFKARGAFSRLTLLSARFEGFDERIVEHLVTDAISVGPYVLSNGDLPAMVMVDAIARRLPGALSEGSGELESFSAELDGKLEYPHYTRPAEFRGWAVPDVLLSGDHARVERWRREHVRSGTPSTGSPRGCRGAGGSRWIGWSRSPARS